MRAQRLIAAAATFLMFAGLVVPAAAIRPQRAIISRAVAQTIIAHGTISGKRNVRITRAGLATISSVNGRSVELRRIPPGISNSLTIGPGDTLDSVSANTLVRSIDRPRFKPYMPGVVNVLFRAGISSYQDAARFTPSKKTVAAYTNDTQVNGVFAKLGVDRITRIASAVDRSRLAGMHARTLSRDSAAFNLANAFQVHLTSSTVPDAVRQIGRLSSVAYAAPDWIVSTMNTGAVIPNRVLLQNLQRSGIGSSTSARFKFSASSGARASSLPANYGITTSLQSFLNAPGIDAVAAYDEIAKKYGELPGQGEIITNVSLGDVCTDPQDAGLKSHRTDVAYHRWSALFRRADISADP